jgi:hypothetical protein
MRRMNFAPTARTIIVALILMILGLLGTYGTVLPDAVGVIAFLASSGILLFGMIVRLF